MTRRILIVDDDPDIREIAKVSLETAKDWTVEEAEDGPSGEAAARAHPPDLVLLDHMMPGQDGQTTLLHLKGDPATRHVPVIILTAKTQAGIETAALDAGARAVLRKPFDPIALADTIAAIMGWDT